ncbi:MAG: alpha-mannosidase [Armatimonadota bacterium]
MADKKAVMHILSHTHWDREWYQDFQGYRQRLVFQIDSLMDLLEQKREFKYFHLDGQTSCLLDYLQIRPECRERLEKHIQSGQILIGPWFVMPDELLLSGESMTRNLMLGYALCDEFGTKPMPFGYVTDIFGHCSQFPQMLRSFGIDTAFLHRGTSTDDEKSEMLWEGADGSDVLLVKVYPYTGYQDFLVLRDASDEILLDYEQKKLGLATTDVLFSMDGNDHQPAYWTIPNYIEKMNKLFKKTTCIHSSMPNYLEALKTALGDNWRKGLKKFTGELRMPNKEGTYAELFYGTASSRVYLKQANDAQEYYLPRVAEPLHAWSILFGGDDQKPFLDLAWKYLLLNHPHDSIVGCSLDQVHHDMMYRFDQSRLIAQNSIWESVQAIDEKLDTLSVGGEGKVVTIHNQSTVNQGPVTRFWFNLRKDLVDANAKEGLVPALISADGELIPFVVESHVDEVYSLPIPRKTHGASPMYGWVPDHWMPASRVNAVVGVDIPALGYRTLKIGFIPKKDAASAKLSASVAPVKAYVKANTIENDAILLTARPDGLVDLLDKATGTWYRGLHAIEDCGDNGQAWDHIYPENDKVVLSTDDGVKGKVTVKTQASSGLTASITVSYSMKVPAGLSKDKKSRSAKTVSVGISTVYTLDAGSKRIDCRTTITNTARNHRMRAILPSNRKCRTWFADTAFDLVERAIKLPDTTGWKEQSREESPIKNLAAVCDDRAGLAILTKGLCEACVQDNDDRSIALTLFRGFEQNIGGYLTQDSQMLGEVTLEYAIHPFIPADGKAPVSLFDEVERFKMPLVALTTDAHAGKMKADGRLIEISDGLTLSTIKLSEDRKAVVVRAFNPAPSAVDARFAVNLPIGEVWVSNPMEEKLVAISKSPDGGFVVPVRAKQILTLRLEIG